MSAAAMRLEYSMEIRDLPVVRSWPPIPRLNDADARRKRQMALLDGILDEYEPAFKELASR